jgi:hypothetical protein
MGSKSRFQTCLCPLAKFLRFALEEQSRRKELIAKGQRHGRMQSPAERRANLEFQLFPVDGGGGGSLEESLVEIGEGSQGQCGRFVDFASQVKANESDTAQVFFLMLLLLRVEVSDQIRGGNHEGLSVTQPAKFLNVFQSRHQVGQGGLVDIIVNWRVGVVVDGFLPKHDVQRGCGFGKRPVHGEPFAVFFVKLEGGS